MCVLALPLVGSLVLLLKNYLTNMAQILKPNRIDNRGGHPNCGRKKGEKKPFQIRCLEKNIFAIRKYILDNNL